MNKTVHIFLASVIFVCIYLATMYCLVYFNPVDLWFAVPYFSIGSVMWFYAYLEAQR